MNKTRYQLEVLNRQHSHLTSIRTFLMNHLIAALEMTYPDANKLFTSPAREDGTQKWVDFIKTFWHLDCVCGTNQAVFKERYQKWCEKNKYNFSSDKSTQIYADAQNRIALMLKNHLTKMIVRQSVDSLIAMSRAVEQLKTEMLKLPE